MFDRYRNDEHALFILDPPYMSSFNTSYYKFDKKSEIKCDSENRVIDNTRMFIDMLDLLSCECKVFLIIAANAITRYIYRDYIISSYEKRYDISGRCATHLIVSNALKKCGVTQLDNTCMICEV